MSDRNSICQPTPVFRAASGPNVQKKSTEDQILGADKRRLFASFSFCQRIWAKHSKSKLLILKVVVHLVAQIEPPETIEGCQPPSTRISALKEKKVERRTTHLAFQNSSFPHKKSVVNGQSSPLITFGAQRERHRGSCKSVRIPSMAVLEQKCPHVLICWQENEWK